MQIVLAVTTDAVHDTIKINILFLILIQLIDGHIDVDNDSFYERKKREDIF
jgi:hypothetical protein